ncbi:MAG: SDR family NAD(P)-dependent oxidoreductase [bacterium]
MKNKIVLITGASSGIGEACTEVFAREGAKLILLARRSEKLNTLALNLEHNYGAEVITFACDVRDKDKVFEIVNSLDEKWRKIDLLINNAGLARSTKKFPDCDFSDWEEMIDTNIKGLLYVSRAVLPVMLVEKCGTIINIGSIAGRTAYPGGNVYCSTKSFVAMLNDTMNIDLNGTGVRVSNIEPGMVETEFSLVRFHGDSETADKVYKGLTPLSGRDVAETALFIATRPQHINIQNIMLTPTDQANPYIVNKNL